MIPTSKLTEIYHDLAENQVMLFSGKYNFDCGADAVIICAGGQYGFFLDIDKIRTVTDENMAVGHEWGHFVTGSTYGMEANDELMRWCEAKAHRAQINKLIPFNELKSAIKEGKTSSFELAEYFDVTEPFVRDAIDYYTSQKGYSFSKAYCDEAI